MTRVRNNGGRVTAKKVRSSDLPAGVTDIADAMARKKPPRLKTRICLESDVVDVRDEAEKAFAQAQRAFDLSDGDPDFEAKMVEAEDLLDEANRAVAAESVDFVFKAVGNRVVEQLKKEHPPTPEQVQAYQAELKAQGMPNDMLVYNPDSFPPVLISKSCVSPPISVEQAREIWDGESGAWSQGEVGTLFKFAWRVNQVVR